MTTVNTLLDEKGRNIWAIHADASVHDAVVLLEEKNIGALTVYNDETQLAGIVSERDCARNIVLNNKSATDTKVGDIMTKDVVFAREDTLLDRCMSLMTQKNIRHLPVVSQNAPVAMVTLGDITKTIIKEQSLTIEELESFIYEDRGGES
jgi:CBS domain-containing protein